jgi:transglutaminase-like putative cysteine protease
VPDAVDTWLYLQYHGPVVLSSEVATLADRFRPSEPDGLLEALQQVMRHIHGNFEYQPEVTTVHSSIEDVLTLRRGVCQDFSHLMIAICRAMDVPTRYVSGYILNSPDRAARGSGASHAWCEAYVPGYGWRGFDPTNNVLAANGHVKVGTGRDYSDVPPTCGIHRGLAAERIEIAVQTVRLDTPEP